jgi:hypothetical protein
LALLLQFGFGSCIIFVMGEVWVNGEPRLSFRRIFTERMMQVWIYFLAVVDNLVFSEEIESLIWCYNSSGIYSSVSFYYH